VSGFDAGSITASLSVDTAKAKADLDKISAEVKKLEDTPHKIKISAVFDNSSMSKARSMFRDLDNAISRDAMQRLRSSPQGSVLGSLNALFSPHPVTGAPSPQQSAAGGLLGKMISGQGGGGPSSTGTAGGGGTSTSTNDIRNVLTGAQPSNTSTTNTIKDVTQGQQPGNITTTDTIKRDVTGTAPGNIETTDTIKEKVDPASKAEVIRDSADTGDKAGAGFAATFTKRLADMFAKIGKSGGGAGGGSGGAGSGGLAAGILGGIGPGILGLSAKVTGIVGAVGSALATLPALAGVAGVGMGVALIGGMVAEVIKGSPKLTAQLKGIGTDAQAMFKTAAAPLIPALSAAFGKIPALLKQIEPQLSGIFKTIAPQISGIFAGLTPVIKGLLNVMSAAAPAFGPFIGGLEKLVGNILPGLAAIIKATVPFISQFGGFLGTLGKNLGGLFSSMAPAVGASMKVLGAFLDLIGGLLPIIGKLAAMFATTLAPAIATFAGVIKSLTPFLTTIGSIIASLAGAVLGDLSSAFSAVAALLTGIAPALNTFAKSLGIVFTTLENSGVFAILGNALEALAGPLATLISALLNGLSPILPPLFTAIGQIAGILAGGLAGAVAAVLPPLTTLATTVLGAIAKILPAVLPLLVAMAGVFTAGVVAVIKGVADGLGAIIKAAPPAVLTGIAVALVAIFAAYKAYGLIQAAVGAVILFTKALTGMDLAAYANPIGLIVLAIAALGTAFYIAWQKSAGFRNIMKDIASDFLTFGILVVEENKVIIGAVLDMFSAIINGAADAFGWVPGIGGKLKTAAAAFDGFKGSVNDAFNKTISTMQGWQQELGASATAAKTNLGDIETAFSNQSKAAADAKTALDNYSNAVQNNGAQSTAAQAARQQLITDLTNAGVNAGTANTDVTNYSNAVAQNGVDSSQAQVARQQLITDILNASANARQGNTDLGNYTTAVRNNGTDSDAARAARTKLINDLVAAGLDSQTATGYVDGLGGSIKDLPAGKNININVTGQGTWTITGLQALLGMSSAGGIKPTPSGAQHGVKIPGYGGGDSVLIAVEPGETVLPKEATSDPMTVAVAKKYGVPGFASGGIAGLGNQITASYNSTQDAMVKSMQQALVDAITKAAAAVSAAAGAGGGPSGYTKTAAGDYSLSQLEALWIAAGGSPGAAYNMARIAIAESGGNPNAYNASGATGLWQIEYPGSQVVAGNLYNPTINAENAVALYNSRGYEPWAADPVGAALSGMASGGIINEPITGVGVSGRMYKFGEAGPEYVIPGNKASGVPGASGSRVEALLEQLIAVTGSLPHGITGGIGNALSGAAQSASMRSRYPRGGSLWPTPL
jgi:phage-related protein